MTEIKRMTQITIPFCSTVPTGVVTFERRSNCTQKIENDDEWKLLNFANKCVDGDVLRYGSDKSEIWFMISPELLVSRLLTEQLDGNEFLSIVGCEKFNAYSSYAANFQWTTDYTDKTPRDE